MDANAPRPGLVVWVTGRPQAGKSTFAAALVERLRVTGPPVVLLDGDAVRGVLVPRPGYDEAARDAFYATLAGLASLLAEQGFCVVVPATAHQRKFRARARELCAGRYLEVHVAASEATARSRDKKGLYASSDAGAMPDLPGRGLVYEEPDAPDIVANGGRDDAALGAAVARIEERSRA